MLMKMTKLYFIIGDDRVFPKVQESLDVKLNFVILKKCWSSFKNFEEFKAGRQDTAEFWINLKVKFIHIRYFAIRDDERNYKGVIEMSQDVTEIRALEGQKRLLDWN